MKGLRMSHCNSLETKFSLWSRIASKWLSSYLFSLNHSIGQTDSKTGQGNLANQ